MYGYRGPLPLTYVYLVTTLAVALIDGSKGIQNQHGSSLGLDRSLAAVRECVDRRRECNYWRCSTKFVRRKCPKKCGLCKQPSTASPSTTYFSSTVKTPTTHGSTTREKIQTTHSSTAVNTPSTHSSSMANAPTTSISTVKLKTPKEEPVTTRHGFQTTLQSTLETTIAKRNGISFSSSSVTEITSTEQRLTEKPTTNQTSHESPNAYATYSKSELDVTMVTSIAVGCLLVIAIVILLFVCKRWRKRRGASLIHEPKSIITMQPFNYTRDETRDPSRDNASRIYEELHARKGIRLTHTEQSTDDLKDNEPFYHVLEGNTQHQSFQDQHLYACADSNSHENKAFDLSGQTVHNQSRSEGVKYETVISTSVHKNQVIQGDNYCKDDFEKPYYHVLEKQDSNYQGNCDGTPLPLYQPLIGVKKEMGNTTEGCRVYQPLTSIRSKGARMS